MYSFSVFKDFETPNHAGARGFYQIIEIKDFDDNDITNQFDQGRFYTDDTLIKDISKKFNLPIDYVDIIEEN
ncbi:MAG TPA: hypothetical protein PLP27_00890 [Crocinitomicaceae bacterium]|nr:hypothetical protein [Crocinitomicaceae bacterium]